MLGVAVIVAGFMLVALGAATGQGGTASTGGFILIGPIPIFFGSGPESGPLVDLAVAIGVAMLAFYVVQFLAWRAGRRREAQRE